MLILAFLKWLGIKEFLFGMTGMAWKEGSRFLSDQNSFEWSKLLAVMDWTRKTVIA
jgi:hypothetical protein